MTGSRGICVALLAWVALVATCLGSVHASSPAPKRACEESGMCSLGISKVWSGDIKDSTAFRQMLEAVSYRKELILSIHGESEGLLWNDQTLQLHAELQYMGYGHFFVIALNKAVCESLHKFEQGISCVWDSSAMHRLGFSGENLMWHLRWKFMGRASRLGYNVMSVDADSIFFRDPYVYLKAPPLKDVNFLCNPEGGGVFHCNGGWIYVQNARPDGPASWVFRYIASYPMRVMDDDFKWLLELGVMQPDRQMCLTFDQDYIRDALVSAASGMPLHRHFLQNCKPRDAKFGSVSFNDALQNIQAVEWALARAQIDQSKPPVGLFAGAPVIEFRENMRMFPITNITIANLDLPFLDEFGGRMVPPDDVPGVYTKAFDDMLKADCPDCPWWPERRPLRGKGDGERSEKLKQALKGKPGAANDLKNEIIALYHEIDKVKPEIFAQTPMWFMSSMVRNRRGVWMGRDAALPSLQSIGHIHYWPRHWRRWHKISVRKVVGRYNYTLGHSLLTRAPGVHSAYANALDVKKILALSPDLDLTRVRNMGELNRIVTGLLQAALLTHRVALLPDLPCETPWLWSSEASTAPDFNATQHCRPPIEFAWDEAQYPMPLPYPVDPEGRLLGGPFSSLAPSAQPTKWEELRYRVAIPYLWDPSCSTLLLALQTTEFHHWLTTQAAMGVQTHPASQNVVFKPDPADMRLQLTPRTVKKSTKGWSLDDLLVSLPVSTVVSEINRHSDIPLLFLGHPIGVVRDEEGPPGQIRRRARRRRLMQAQRHDHDTPNDAYRHVEMRMRDSGCRALMVDPKGSDTFEDWKEGRNLIYFNRTQKGVVKGGILHLA